MNPDIDTSSRTHINWRKIEETWRQIWDKEKIFYAEINSKKKYYVTVAYPYPNSPQHVGHGRTYTLADVHARYMRMKGYNVLFPMGFHYTGTPIVAMSQRIEAMDKELIETFRKIYGISDEIISGFTNPLSIAKFFHNEIKQGMKEMGYSIDWRREFTTIDEGYSKFISWQFRTLQRKGLIVKGSHPVGWCPKDQNPVSQHDTIGDVEPEITEYILYKFKFQDFQIPTATLRPETIFGVTNLWINPDLKYVKAKVNNEIWLMTYEAANKLKFQNYEVSIMEDLMGNELVGEFVSDQIRGSKIPIFPASFVDPQNGTGIVMSVPAHAPYDFQALEDLKGIQDHRIKNIAEVINPITIIASNNFEYDRLPPAQQIMADFAIKDQADSRLDEVTKKLYSIEFYNGIMLAMAGEFSGMTVKVARDKVKEMLLGKGIGNIMYELADNSVRCRCGTNCVIKVITDQWFINYGDENWKKLAHSCINSMEITPDEIRQEFDNVLDWLKERACARKVGLGTKLPWDDGWIIESLSDSVIYMAYYILAKYINDNTLDAKILPGSLDDEFFDFVLLGLGDPDSISKTLQIPSKTVMQIREDFLYFYPVDSRHSGRDLIPNHLSFYIFNHVAIFGEEEWPRQIVVNGSVLMEGKKMSKSLGNIIPLRNAIEEYGADPIRLAMISSAELLQDADFSFDIVKGIRLKLTDFYELITKLGGSQQNYSNDLHEELEDQWLQSRIQRSIADTTCSLDKLRVRQALHDILYTMEKDMQWYFKRSHSKKRNPLSNPVLREFLDTKIRLLSPFAPHIGEELWKTIGHENLLSNAAWPRFDESKISNLAEENEYFIFNVITDIQKITKIARIHPNRIIIYTASMSKWKLYHKLLIKIQNESKSNFGTLIKELVSDKDVSKVVKGNPDLVKKMTQDILSESSEIRSRRMSFGYFDESVPLKDALDLIKEELGADQLTISIAPEDDSQIYDPKGKSKHSRPFKPAIFIE